MLQLCFHSSPAKSKSSSQQVRLERHRKMRVTVACNRVAQRAALRGTLSRCSATQQQRQRAAAERRIVPGEEDALTPLESTPTFVARLLLASVGGGALLKWGSLLLSAPFEHSAVLATLLVALPCVVYAAILLARGATVSK